MLPTLRAFVGAAILVGLLELAGRVSTWTVPPVVRRRLDAATAAALIGFGVQPAVE